MTRQARRELVTEGVKQSTDEAGMLFFVDDMVMVAESEEKLQSNTVQLQKKVIIKTSTTCFIKSQHTHKATIFCQKAIWSVVHSKQQQQNLWSLSHVVVTGKTKVCMIDNS